MANTFNMASARQQLSKEAMPVEHDMYSAKVDPMVDEIADIMDKGQSPSDFFSTDDLDPSNAEESVQPQLNQQKAALDAMRAWVQSKANADFKGGEQPPLPDPNWFSEEPYNGIQYPYGDFIKAMRSTLMGMQVPRGQIEGYTTELVQQARALAASQNVPVEPPKKKPKTQGEYATPSEGNKTLPQANDYARIFGPMLHQKMEQSYPDDYAEFGHTASNAAMSAFGVSNGGVRADLWWLSRDGYKYVTPELKAQIAQTAGLVGDNGSPDIETLDFMQQSQPESVEAAMKEASSVVNPRLSDLIKFCSDDPRDRQAAVTSSPDLAKFSGEQREKLKSDLFNRGWGQLTEYELKGAKRSQLRDRNRRRERATSSMGTAGGESLDISRDISKPQSITGEPQQQMRPNEQQFMSVLTDTVLPNIRNEIKQVAGNIRRLGSDMALYMARTPSSKTMYYDIVKSKKRGGGDDEEGPAVFDPQNHEYKGRQYQEPKGRIPRYKTRKNSHEIGQYFSKFTQVVARELELLAAPHNTTTLMPLVMRVAQEDNLIPAGLSPEFSKFKSTDSLPLNSVNPQEQPGTGRLGDLATQEQLGQLQQTNPQLHSLWGEMNHDDTKPQPKSLVSHINLSRLAKNVEFARLLANTRTFKDDKGRQRITIKPKDQDADESEFMQFADGVKKKMYQEFVWWAPFMLVPEVMNQYDVLTRRILLDALPIAEGYKDGTSKQGQGKAAFLFHAIRGDLKNAPVSVRLRADAPPQPVSLEYALSHVFDQRLRGKWNRAFTYLFKRWQKAQAQKSACVQIRERMSKFASVDKSIIDDHILELDGEIERLEFMMGYLVEAMP